VVDVLELLGAEKQPLVLERYHDVLCRDYTVDKGVVKQCRKNYQHFNLDEKSRVVDLGANIGAFAVMCSKVPILEYYGFEPDPDNYEVLLRNLEECKSTTGRRTWWSGVDAAVTPRDELRIDFYIKPGTSTSANRTATPTRVTRALRRITVDNVHVDLVMSIRPTHLKMDIEGGERDILDHWKGHIPEGVREVFIEVHRHPYVLEFHETHHKTILADGFEMVYCNLCRRYWQNSEWEVFGQKGVMPRPPTILTAEIIYRRTR